MRKYLILILIVIQLNYGYSQTQNIGEIVIQKETFRLLDNGNIDSINHNKTIYKFSDLGLIKEEISLDQFNSSENDFNQRKNYFYNGANTIDSIVDTKIGCQYCEKIISKEIFTYNAIRDLIKQEEIDKGELISYVSFIYENGIKRESLVHWDNNIYKSQFDDDQNIIKSVSYDKDSNKFNESDYSRTKDSEIKETRWFDKSNKSIIKIDIEQKDFIDNRISIVKRVSNDSNTKSIFTYSPTGLLEKVEILKMNNSVYKLYLTHIFKPNQKIDNQDLIKKINKVLISRFL